MKTELPSRWRDAGPVVESLLQGRPTTAAETAKVAQLLARLADTTTMMVDKTERKVELAARELEVAVDMSELAKRMDGDVKGLLRLYRTRVEPE